MRFVARLRARLLRLIDSGEPSRTPPPSEPREVEPALPVDTTRGEFAGLAAPPTTTAEAAHFTGIALTCPKESGPNTGNEDALALDGLGSRAAVFDGATESFAAQRWSGLLAEHWLGGQPDWVAQAQVSYADALATKSLTWAQEAASERGSFATVAAVTVLDDALELVIVGDSCVFIFDDTELVASLPYTSADEFTSAPHALSSDPRDNAHNDDALASAHTRIPRETGDITHVLLATDAVSAWLLCDDVGERQRRISEITNSTDSIHFTDLVMREREAGRMKVDDSTVVLLTLKVPV